MRLFLVKRTDNVDYDQYDSLVVVAKNATRAKKLKPLDNDWTNDYKNLHVHEIGTASIDLGEGILLGSFNAG